MNRIAMILLAACVALTGCQSSNPGNVSVGQGSRSHLMGSAAAPVPSTGGLRSPRMMRGLRAPRSPGTRQSAYSPAGGGGAASQSSPFGVYYNGQTGSGAAAIGGIGATFNRSDRTIYVPPQYIPGATPAGATTGSYRGAYLDPVTGQLSYY